MNIFGKEPRPKFNEAIRKQLADQVGKLVFDWCNDETDLEDCVSDSLKILKWSHLSDGYQLAKSFEEEGYSPDSELVEILESVDFLRFELLHDAVKKWVIEDEIKPQFEVGARIMVSRKGEKVEAIITGCRKDTAEYRVGLTSNTADEVSVMELIVKYEDVEMSGAQ